MKHRERDELREEVNFHLEQEVKKRGSQREAAAVFGSPERVVEEMRDARGRRWLENLARDTRQAVRGLRRAPAFALAAIATLALGIGANTAIFTWVNAELLRALPYAQPQRLVAINEDLNGRLHAISHPDFLDWQKQNGSHGAFAAMAWMQANDANLAGAGEPAVVTATDVSANFFRTLGAAPMLGREFAPGADTAAAEPEAILSFGLWQKQFGGSMTALGAKLELNQRVYTVIGVMPPEFRDFGQSDLYVPDGLFLKNLADRGAHDNAVAIARLAPGASLQQGGAQLRAGMARLRAAYPEDDGGEEAVARPLRALFVGSDAPMLWLLLGATGLVLLLACANLANLMLVRTEARRAEWEMRAALGASRARLFAQILIESLVLAAAGGAAGLGVGGLALRGLRRFTAGSGLALTLDARVLGVTAAAAIGAALVFGIGPALHAAQARARTDRRPRRGGVLVVSEIALALLLACGAGLMLKSFSRLMRVSPGFEPQHVLTLGVNLAGPAYASDPAVLHYEQGALERLRHLPGVEVAALGTNLPLTDNHDRGDVTIAGAPLPAPGHYPHPDFHSISPGYLAALGLPLLRGRDFTPADAAGAPKVALVSAGFAQRYWPGVDPIGRSFWLQHPGPRNPNLMTVVGVVGDTRQYALDQPARIEIYLSYLQYPIAYPTFLLRTSLPPLTLAGAARAALHAVDATAPVTNVQTMDQAVAASVANPRATLWLLEIFGGLALLLAAIGIYGVVSYAAQRRTGEIGIRMALGAGGGAIARLIGGSCLRQAGLGLGLGLAAVLAAGPAMRALLYQVQPGDAGVLAGACLLVALVAAMASAVPVWRACRIAPWRALRHE